MTDYTLLRIPAVCQETGKSRSSQYNDIKAGLMTQPVRVGRGAVGWPAGEVRQIVQARIAGKSEDQIRQLVANLHAARQVAA